MQIGMIGLGVMGQNLALNIAGKGFQVAAFDASESRRREVSGKFRGQAITLFETLQ